MTRSIRTFPAVSVLHERRKGLPRERRFNLTDGSPALVRERLDIFAAAFLADVRPGLIFEYGRLVFANDAARNLLRSTSASDGFIEALKVSVGKGAMERRLLLRTSSGIYAPVLHPARSRQGHLTRICFLIRRSRSTAAYDSLSKRELDVLRLLVKGLTNSQIAEELGISIETVRKHVSRAFEKTGTKTRAGLVGRALGRQDNNPIGG
jgi:DNA-binding CsgD family transcriptional regulator